MKHNRLYEHGQALLLLPSVALIAIYAWIMGGMLDFMAQELTKKMMGGF